MPAMLTPCCPPLPVGDETRQQASSGRPSTNRRSTGVVRNFPLAPCSAAYVREEPSDDHASCRPDQTSFLHFATGPLVLLGWAESGLLRTPRSFILPVARLASRWFSTNRGPAPPGSRTIHQESPCLSPSPPAH